MSSWQRWDEILGRVEKFLVAAMLSTMILLAFLLEGFDRMLNNPPVRI